MTGIFNEFTEGLEFIALTTWNMIKANKTLCVGKDIRQNDGYPCAADTKTLFTAGSISNGGSSKSLLWDPWVLFSDGGPRRHLVLLLLLWPLTPKIETAT